MQIRMEFAGSTLNYMRYRWRDGDRERTLYIPRADFRFDDEDVPAPECITIIVSSRKNPNDSSKENELLRRENLRLKDQLMRARLVLQDRG